MSKFMSVCNLFKNVVNTATNLQQTRNTFILRRVHKPLLVREGARRRKMTNKYFIYKLVEDTSIKPLPPLKLILTSDVFGYGEKGDLIELKPDRAYKELLLPNLAVYASPENMKKYNVVQQVTETVSPLVFVSNFTAKLLQMHTISIYMSRTEPWVLEPWHVRVALRNHCFFVPENHIKLPSSEIRGPDLSLREKIFCIGVNVNNKENVNVRCRIIHWPKGLDAETSTSYESLFPEQEDIIKELKNIDNRPKGRMLKGKPHKEHI